MIAVIFLGVFVNEKTFNPYSHAGGGSVMPIHQLFPEPIYFSQLNRELTKEELNTIKKYKKKTHKNIGNVTSFDTYVLENKKLKNLKKDLATMVLDYFNKVICTDDSIVPYITQSWINYTETDQFHHRHSHSNSYISGVFYIDADKQVDSIKFYKPGSDERAIKPTVDKYNIFNSSNWQFPVQTGNIILFPSALRHGVERKKGTNTRISLSFNAFFKGTIGKKRELPELIL